jgi:hypothetical protein
MGVLSADVLYGQFSTTYPAGRFHTTKHWNVDHVDHLSFDHSCDHVIYLSLQLLHNNSYLCMDMHSSCMDMHFSYSNDNYRS